MRQRGNVLLALLIGITICAALCASIMTTTLGHRHEADADLSGERSFHLAEAGIDWGMAQMRIGNGVIPATPVETRDVAGAGRFVLRYQQGDANGTDDNGDGVIDEPAEATYATLTSTGESGGVRRTVQMLVRKAVEIPSFDSSVEINVDAPVLDMNGNAFTVSGEEHLLDGTIDATRPAKYGISSPADVADLALQLSALQSANVTGAGGSPSIGKVAAIDLTKLMQQASGAASVVLTPGTHTPTGLGTPDAAGVVVAYCNGDLHLSGGGCGAGVLAVDGDLEISGDFQWVGMILVRGRIRMDGGGGSERIIGVMASGEEIASASGTTRVRMDGTVDLLYSSDAVALAAQRLSVVAVMYWREAANPCDALPSLVVLWTCAALADETADAPPPVEAPVVTPREVRPEAPAPSPVPAKPSARTPEQVENLRRVILDGLADHRSVARAEAAELLVATWPDSASIFDEALTAKSVEVRVEATRLLARKELGDTHEWLRRRIGDDSPLVRTQAIRVARHLAWAAVEKDLVPLVASDPSWAVRQEALRTLEDLGTANCLATVLAGWRDEKDKERRNRYRRVLAKIVGSDHGADAEAWAKAVDEAQRKKLK